MPHATTAVTSFRDGERPGCHVIFNKPIMAEHRRPAVQRKLYDDELTGMDHTVAQFKICACSFELEYNKKYRPSSNNEGYTLAQT